LVFQILGEALGFLLMKDILLSIGKQKRPDTQSVAEEF